MTSMKDRDKGGPRVEDGLQNAWSILQAPRRPATVILTMLAMAQASSLFVASCDAQAGDPPAAHKAARVSPAAPKTPQDLRSPIGTNLTDVSYHSAQLPFVDVMKSSGEWISGDRANWDNRQKLDLDANGWVRSLAPGQIAHTLIFRSIGSHYPAGQYLVKYKGQGTLKFEFAARVVSQRQGQMLLQVTPAHSGIHLVIESTDSTDYLRDIEITLPGGICEGNPYVHASSPRACGAGTFLSYADNAKTILFNPGFLNRLRGYSVLRFMDWMRTNDSKVTDWSQRPLVSSQTWGGRSGVPVEIMIELANRLGAHPWYTLPHQSNDDYARKFAQLVGATQDARLRVYVEHSNEVWNSQFAQYRHIVEKAAAQSPPLNNMQYHALRTRAIGEVFRDVLGSRRVITVLGAQAANTWTASSGLEYLKKRFNGDLGIDALAIAPYFAITPNPKTAGTYTAMTLDALVTHVRDVVLPPIAGTVDKYRNVADAHGLPLIAYEGGQHLVGVAGAENNDALTALFHAFNRDPRIKQLYLDYLATWKRSGGQLFVHFNDVGTYSKWGSWGSLEYADQPRASAPKFDAIQTFLEQNPVWWKQ